MHMYVTVSHFGLKDLLNALNLNVIEHEACDLNIHGWKVAADQNISCVMFIK